MANERPRTDVYAHLGLGVASVLLSQIQAGQTFPWRHYEIANPTWRMTSEAYELPLKSGSRVVLTRREVSNGMSSLSPYETVRLEVFDPDDDLVARIEETQQETLEQLWQAVSQAHMDASRPALREVMNELSTAAPRGPASPGEGL